MYRIHCLNKISSAGTNLLGDSYSLTDSLDDANGVLVRSAAMQELAFPKDLYAIARAGAGVNNIPIAKCSEEGIAVFNTPGANANAVKELVLAALLLTSRKILPAAEWAKSLKGQEGIGKLVEKGKGAFAGPEISGKSLGVIGLGAIGVLVANAAKSLGMTVYGYDPFLSVDAAWNLSRSIIHAHTLDEIASCDYITIHVPLLDSTRGTIGKDFLSKANDGVRILNFARGELVDTDAILEGLASGKVAAYATDFPEEKLLGVENVIAIPHLGASTPESEDNCAAMAARELTDYLENGNVSNSVNFPAVDMSREGDTRFCIFHRNVPNTISLLSGILGGAGVNIENMQSKSRGDYAYTLFDTTGGDASAALKKLTETDAVIRVRTIS